MAKNNLRQALQSADLQADDLARLVDVDTRTVRRWVAGQTPYPRHRIKIARALELPEEALWPDIPSASQTQVRDLVTGYPTSESIGIPSSESLVQAAQDRIELLDRMLADYFDSEGLFELLLQKAREGVPVRILVAETSRQLVALLDQSGLELRAGDPDEHQAIHRYDNQMLITLPLAGEPDDPPPLLHLRRKGTDGLFDRFASHYQDSWEHATPLRSEADIRDYLSEDELADQDDRAEDLHPAGEHVTALPVEAPASPPRHWPRRPS